jgi:hypothetical protein
MLVTFAVALPEPFVTVQLCTGLIGCVSTVTAYVLVTAVAKVKVPFAAIVRLSPPLSCRTIPVPRRPTTVPPMVSVPAPEPDPEPEPEPEPEPDPEPEPEPEPPEVNEPALPLLQADSRRARQTRKHRGSCFIKRFIMILGSFTNLLRLNTGSSL